MTDHEATYLIGLAVRRAMIDTAFPAELRAQAWAVYSAATVKALTPDEAIEVRRATGLIDLSGQWAEGARV